MGTNRSPKLRFGLKSMFVLMLGVAIGLAADQWAAMRIFHNAPISDFAGLKLSEEPRGTFNGGQSRYRGGMRINSVRPNSSAAEAGILPGDILVGMHKWETATQQDVEFIQSQQILDQLGKVKFYVLRDGNTLYGSFTLAGK